MSSYDVIVLGGGPSGCAAAWGAAQCGGRVLLVERSFTLGGAATQSLIGPLQTFHGPRGRIIGGFGHLLIARLKERGAALGYVRDPVGFAGSLAPADSEAMKGTLVQMLEEAGVDLLLGEGMATVTMEQGRIASLVTPSGKALQAQCFVDGSGNGDLTHLAGVPMEYDDDAQPMSVIFKMRGVRRDEVVQAEKDCPENFVLHPDPATLDREYFAACGFFREVRTARDEGRFTVPRDRILFFMTHRSDEVVVNSTRVRGNALDAAELSRAWLEGLRQVRELVAFMHRDIPGFARAELTQLPECIGVRETRRMAGAYVLKEDEIIHGAEFPDSIARGAFPLDIHSSTGAGLESHLLEGPGDYSIPLRALRSGKVKNLVTVGRCISVTHKGFSSTRVMPTSMAVGHAGGVAAAVMVQRGVFDDALVLDDVQQQLTRQGAILTEAQIIAEML